MSKGTARGSSTVIMDLAISSPTESVSHFSEFVLLEDMTISSSGSESATRAENFSTPLIVASFSVECTCPSFFWEEREELSAEGNKCDC